MFIFTPAQHYVSIIMMIHCHYPGLCCDVRVLQYSAVQYCAVYWHWYCCLAVVRSECWMSVGTMKRWGPVSCLLALTLTGWAQANQGQASRCSYECVKVYTLHTSSEFDQVSGSETEDNLATNCC